MGTDCAPLIADLSFEFKFMKKLIRMDISVARKLNKTFRYIDDLLTQNKPRFLNSIGQIYPHEKKTTESPTNCSYLDPYLALNLPLTFTIKEWCLYFSTNLVPKGYVSICF